MVVVVVVVCNCRMASSMAGSGVPLGVSRFAARFRPRRACGGCSSFALALALCFVLELPLLVGTDAEGKPGRPSTPSAEAITLAGAVGSSTLLGPFCRLHATTSTTRRDRHEKNKSAGMTAGQAENRGHHIQDPWKLINMHTAWAVSSGPVISSSERSSHSERWLGNSAMRNQTPCLHQQLLPNNAQQAPPAPSLRQSE